MNYAVASAVAAGYSTGDNGAVAFSPAVAAQPQTRGTLVDQAVFTSIRSPMGCGYRIIAASPGITAVEKSEITRWSPSQRSLCALEGLASYRLSTNRQVIACSRPAGLEPTARGGDRVHTHVVVLDPEDYAEFDWNPVSVFRATEPFQQASNLAPRQDLPALELQPVPQEVAPVGEAELDLACAASSAAMAGQATIALCSAPSLNLLEWMLLMTPPYVRRRLAVSTGLNYSPIRPMQVAFVTADVTQLRRAAAGHAVQILEPAACRLEAVHPAEWFSLIRRWARQNRWNDLVELLRRLKPDVHPEHLDALASLCEELDFVRAVDPIHLPAVIQKYQDRPAANTAESWLLQRFLALAERRQAESTPRNPA